MKDYEKTGVLTLQDLNVPTDEQLKKGVAVIECVQEIPCNPCVDVCPVNAISMEHLNAPPHVDYEKCIGCGQCVAICPGLAIFLVTIRNNKALVTLPYEMLPLPRKGTKVTALDRRGKATGTAIVTKLVKQMDTVIITAEVAQNQAMNVRSIQVKS